MAFQPEGIRSFVFDAYGTLFDVHSPAAALAGQIGEHAGAFSALWRAKQLEYTWLRSLMGRHADFARVTADALDYALEAHGLDDARLRDELFALYRTLKPYPDASGALGLLKLRGYRTAILSNGSPDMLHAAVSSANLGDLLERVISVEEVGIYKPSPKVYQLAVDAFSLAAPSEVAFVSANGWDCAGASSFGFQVIQVNRFNQRAERLGFPPAAQVANLSEIEALLGAAL
jgi:2-haloacid dehalogenase